MIPLNPRSTHPFKRDSIFLQQPRGFRTRSCPSSYFDLPPSSNWSLHPWLHSLHLILLSTSSICHLLSHFLPSFVLSRNKKHHHLDWPCFSITLFDPCVFIHLLFLCFILALVQTFDPSKLKICHKKL